MYNFILIYIFLYKMLQKKIIYRYIFVKNQHIKLVFYKLKKQTKKIDYLYKFHASIHLGNVPFSFIFFFPFQNISSTAVHLSDQYHGRVPLSIHTRWETSVHFAHYGNITSIFLQSFIFSIFLNQFILFIFIK